MKAKDYAKLQQAARKVDRDKAFHFDQDPELKDYLIKDAIGSMISKVQKYGTSQDPEEWTNPPEFSNPSEHKGFVMIICKYKDKFKGIAKEVGTGSIDLAGDWLDDQNAAGKQIVKYIDLFRKQATMKKLEDIVEQRKRAMERSLLKIN